MARFRKKPVVIEAVQLCTYEEAAGTPGVCIGACRVEPMAPHIHTLEGSHNWTAGDWMIVGIKGERYFCKPDIFAATYEPAGDR